MLPGCLSDSSQQATKCVRCPISGRRSTRKGADARIHGRQLLNTRYSLRTDKLDQTLGKWCEFETFWNSTKTSHSAMQIHKIRRVATSVRHNNWENKYVPDGQQGLSARWKRGPETLLLLAYLIPHVCPSGLHFYIGHIGIGLYMSHRHGSTHSTFFDRRTFYNGNPYYVNPSR